MMHNEKTVKRGSTVNTHETETGLWLFLGGMASGKSQVAERWISTVTSHRPITYIATLDDSGSHDQELAEKISRHRRRRPPEVWHTVAVTGVQALEEALIRAEDGPVLLDGLGAAFARHPLAVDWQPVLERIARTAISGPLAVVSDEVGWALVPADPSLRAYVNQLGRIHQQLASLAAGVVLVVAGQSLWIKGQPDA